jgi:formylglycine-generating enzyme required for sulfatase activity
MDKPRALLGELLAAPINERNERYWIKAWLAGDVLLELGLERARETDLGGQQAEMARHRLAELLKRGKLAARPRALAGRSLARLDDPRFRSDRWRLPDEPCLGFLEVPAGLFRMGSDPEQDREANKYEQPQHELSLPSFFIARYPTTNAQFAAFVQDGGYDEARWWDEARAAKFWTKKGFQGRWDDEPRQKPVEYGAPFNLPNHPVVGISWYEALAYTRWLGEKLAGWARQGIWQRETKTEAQRQFWQGLATGRLVAALPGEAEWEKAARAPLPSPLGRGAGGEGESIYPWGDEFDPDKGNTSETGIGTTTAVGCFPGGASPCGALDLSGNAWEWTRSLWGDYPYPQDGEALKARENLSAGPDVRRVLRGGSFGNSARYARGAVRDWYSPDFRNWYLGLRVVVVPAPLVSGDSGALGL